MGGFSPNLSNAVKDQKRKLSSFSQQIQTDSERCQHSTCGIPDVPRKILSKCRFRIPLILYEAKIFFLLWFLQEMFVISLGRQVKQHIEWQEPRWKIRIKVNENSRYGNFVGIQLRLTFLFFENTRTSTSCRYKTFSNENVYDVFFILC